MTVHHHDGCQHEGIYQKYEVRRTDGADQPGGPHEGCEYLVLDLTHDPSARFAARIYAEDIEHGPRHRFAQELLHRLAVLGHLPLVSREFRS